MVFIDNMIGELSKEIMKKMWCYWKIEIDRIAVMR